MRKKFLFLNESYVIWESYESLLIKFLTEGKKQK